MTEEEKNAMNENEIKFRAYLLILNSEFSIHRKTEAMKELLKIYNNQQKEIEELKKDKKALVDNYNKVLSSFISKDKLREYIEEHKMEEGCFDFDCNRTIYIYKIYVDKLLKFLEE